MDSDRHIWRCWARNLQQWGVSDVVAAILDASGPLTVLGAQLIYISQPLLSRLLPDEQLEGVARLLEDSSLTKDFVKFLREADTT
jgi:hypothetical protein